MLWIDTALTWYLIILSFILGTVFGSFFNCAAWRMCNGKKVWEGRSICPSCGHTLSAPDLVPVFSYLFLHGKCRYCGTRISPRYMIAELILGAAFTGLLLRFDVTPQLMIYLALSCVLFTESLTDIESLEIPDGLQIAAVVIWLVSLPLFGGNIWKHALNGLLGGVSVAGALLLLSLIADRVMKRDTLGGADIKLFFVAGLYLGAAGNLLNVIVSCFVGLIFAAATQKKREQAEDPKAFPFGPSIAISTYLGLIFAEPVINWYIGLF